MNESRSHKSECVRVSHVSGGGLSWQSGEKKESSQNMYICDYILRGNNPLVYINTLCYLFFQLLEKKKKVVNDDISYFFPKIKVLPPT